MEGTTSVNSSGLWATSTAANFSDMQNATTSWTTTQEHHITSTDSTTHDPPRDLSHGLSHDLSHDASHDVSRGHPKPHLPVFRKSGALFRLEELSANISDMVWTPEEKDDETGGSYVYIVSAVLVVTVFTIVLIVTVHVACRKSRDYDTLDSDQCGLLSGKDSGSLDNTAGFSNTGYTAVDCGSSSVDTNNGCTQAVYTDKRDDYSNTFVGVSMPLVHDVTQL